DFEFKPEEQHIIREVRALIEAESTPELLEETLSIGNCYGGKLGREFIRKFAANGWLTPNWPKAHGGLDASAMLTFAIREEMAYALVPCIFVAAHMAGPTILHVGSDEMKQEWLLPIAKGEVEFALGYSEPEAGSDLSNVNLRAVDKGDHFVLNGQKTFNTHSHVADYHWLACRTDPEVKKHRGMSMMIVDFKSPGITIRPMITLAGWQTNEVYYDDVVVPKKNLVGKMNRGFYYLMAALDYERMFPSGGYRRLFEEVVQYARETVVGGKPLSKDPLVRQKLAQAAIELEAGTLLYYSLAHILDSGKIPNYQSSMQKIYTTEVAQRLTNTCMEIVGLYGQLKRGSLRAPFDGRLEHQHRWSIVESIYGGTNEIQRNIIAHRGLKLPAQ
ncbi:MAG: acyl-CoA dehydrogenase family protein, partial [Deltaproteobacteria bacterium]|nr:acyl-CoA dehydrogenase family protein [Deltaproteobacteria bacterium]